MPESMASSQAQAELAEVSPQCYIAFDYATVHNLLGFDIVEAMEEGCAGPGGLVRGFELPQPPTTSLPFMVTDRLVLDALPTPYGDTKIPRAKSKHPDSRDCSRSTTK